MYYSVPPSKQNPQDDSPVAAISLELSHSNSS